MVSGSLENEFFDDRIDDIGQGLCLHFPPLSAARNCEQSVTKAVA